MESPLPKYVSVALALIGAAGGLWARFVVIEERQANQLAVIARLTSELAALRSRVETEERATRERFFASDLRLSALEDRCPLTVTVKKRRQR